MEEWQRQYNKGLVFILQQVCGKHMAEDPLVRCDVYFTFSSACKTYVVQPHTEAKWGQRHAMGVLLFGW